MDEGSDASAENRPSWWVENQRLREEMDLPPYEPSRFVDGTYTHRVVERLEAEYDREIRFAAVEPRYPDDWEVRADGETLFSIARRRDEHGNTVYRIDADSFERSVREALDG